MEARETVPSAIVPAPPSKRRHFVLDNDSSLLRIYGKRGKTHKASINLQDVCMETAPVGARPFTKHSTELGEGSLMILLHIHGITHILRPDAYCHTRLLTILQRQINASSPELCRQLPRACFRSRSVDSISTSFPVFSQSGQLTRASSCHCRLLSLLSPSPHPAAFHQLPWFAGKTVVMTGGTAGAGVYALDAIARYAARVFLVCRSADKGDAIVTQLACHRAVIEVIPCDLSLLTDVKLACDKILSQSGREFIDALWLNADCHIARSHKKGHRATTAEGLEVMFATNQAASHLMLRLLAPGLALRARVVIASSSAATEATGWRLCDALGRDVRLQGEGGKEQYIRTKLMAMMTAAEFQRRWMLLPIEQLTVCKPLNSCVCPTNSLSFKRLVSCTRRADAAGYEWSVLAFNPGLAGPQIRSQVSALSMIATRLLRALSFARTPEMAASLGLAAAGGEAPIRGWLSDGDLGTPRLHLEPTQLDELGDCAPGGRCERLWHQTDELVRGVIGPM